MCKSSTQDHLGSSRIITSNSGQVISRHDYMAFGSDITQEIGNVGGRTTAQGFNSADEVRKQYTGYERDDESGLDFAQARYYNSNHGRFTSVDPLTASASIRDPQTFNRYSYVLNSPYKFVDPLGLISVNAGSACGGWCKNSDGGSGGLASSYPTAIPYGVMRAWTSVPPPSSSKPRPVGSQGQSDPVWLQELRNAYPELKGNDRNAALGAILDSRDSVDSSYSAILTLQFRNKSNSPTPQQALAGLEIGSIEVIRDKQTGDVLNANIKGNVFDGRTSTLNFDHDNNGDTPDITVAEYFNQNPQTRAIHFTREGYSSIFLGSGFFDQDRAGKAKSIIHEGVVHGGFGRKDAEFDPQRRNRTHEGSLEINRKIDQFFRLKEPIIIDR